MQRKSKGTPMLSAHFRNLIRGSSGPLQTVSSIRRQLRPESYKSLIDWLPKIAFKGRQVFACAFPDRVEQLRNHEAILDSVSLENELIWAAQVLQKHGPALSDFVAQTRILDQHVLHGKLAEATDLIATIESRAGVSFWSIERHIALLQAAKGLEAQKSYATTVRERRPSGDLVAAVVFYISQRNEQTTNPFRFIRQFSENMEQWRLPEELQTYLLYRVTDRVPNEEPLIASILRYESPSALVDYYETFLRLAIHTISRVPRASAEKFLEPLRTLRSNISDLRLSKLIFLITSDESMLSDARPEALESYELYAASRFEDAIRACDQALAVDAKQMGLWFVRARAEAELRQPPPEGDSHVGNLRRLIFTMIDKTVGVEDAFFDLTRFALNWRFAGFSPALRALAWREVSNHPLPDSRSGLSTFINSDYLEIHAASNVPEHCRAAYALALSRFYGPSPIVDVELRRVSAGATIGMEASVAKDILTQVDIEHYLRADDYTAALQAGEALARSSSRLSRRRAARVRAHCLLALGQVEQAASLIANECITDAGLRRMLPIERCADRFDKPTRKRLAAHLSVPIILDLFSRHIDDRLDNVRAYAYEDFLLAYRLEKPSQLKPIIDRFDRNLMIYYLRHLCIPDVMQVSSAYGGSRDLEDERLAVCAMLTSLDDKNAKEYEAEIRDITRRQIIHQGVRQVEKSKIYIDVAAIRRWAEKDLKEAFARYQALLRAGMDSGASGFNEAVKDVLSGRPVSQEFLELPKNEASDLLLSMALAFHKECMTNPEHGLDCYLSMRIRHGALSGQLRGPLEEEKVITQRASDSSEYKSNEHWRSELYYLDGRQLSALDDRLRSFSKDFDGLIETFVRNYVQVQSHEKKTGLFKAPLTVISLRALAVDITPTCTFDEFLDACFTTFWESVEAALKGARNYIDSSFKPQLNQLFLNLESDVEVLAADFPVPELNRSIRIAQTGAQQAVEQVKDWFRLAKPLAEPGFSFEHLVDIGLQCVKKIHRDFDPLITEDIGQIPPLVGLTLFSDIFFIVFDNIRRHSGVGSSPRVTISAQSVGGNLHINIASEVATAAAPEAQARVERIKRAIAAGDYQSAVRSEGGTGLIKLRNIVGPDRSVRRMDFGFRNDGWFFVELNLGVTTVFEETVCESS